jgi:hypothetical protein
VIIRELLCIEKPEGLMAIGNMGIQAKVRVISSLAQYAFKVNELGPEIVALANAIQKFDKFRNDVIHGLWVHFPKGTNQLALLRRTGLQEQVKPRPDKDVITDLPVKILELQKIQNEAQRITVALKALRGKFE